MYYIQKDRDRQTLIGINRYRKIELNRERRERGRETHGDRGSDGKALYIK